MLRIKKDREMKCSKCGGSLRFAEKVCRMEKETVNTILVECISCKTEFFANISLVSPLVDLEVE